MYSQFKVVARTKDITDDKIRPFLLNLIRIVDKPILITLHGGCFVGGDASWDTKQTNCLKECGFDVHQLDFPKDNLFDTITYVGNYIKALNKEVYILGRSSGGYLAKVIYNKYPDLIKKAIYLAPVFNPEMRANINTKFKSKQDYYFRYVDKYPETLTFDKDNEILILASNDENVPMECFTEYQLNNAHFIDIATHKGVTTTTSRKFCKIIKQALLT